MGEEPGVEDALNHDVGGIGDVDVGDSGELGEDRGGAAGVGMLEFQHSNTEVD